MKSNATRKQTLSELMLDRGMSVSSLMEHTGISRRTVYRARAGHSVTSANILSMARALRVGEAEIRSAIEASGGAV